MRVRDLYLRSAVVILKRPGIALLLGLAMILDLGPFVLLGRLPWGFVRISSHTEAGPFAVWEKSALLDSQVGRGISVLFAPVVPIPPMMIGVFPGLSVFLLLSPILLAFALRRSREGKTRCRLFGEEQLLLRLPSVYLYFLYCLGFLLACFLLSELDVVAAKPWPSETVERVLCLLAAGLLSLYAGAASVFVGSCIWRVLSRAAETWREAILEGLQHHRGYEYVGAIFYTTAGTIPLGITILAGGHVRGNMLLEFMFYVLPPTCVAGIAFLAFKKTRPPRLVKNKVSWSLHRLFRKLTIAIRFLALLWVVHIAGQFLAMPVAMVGNAHVWYQSAFVVSEITWSFTHLLTFLAAMRGLRMCTARSTALVPLGRVT